MKKILFVLAALMFAGPALAAVDITCTDEGDGWCAISFDASGEPNYVRAFALDISISDGNIVDVNDEVNDDYVIFPGTIDIDDGQIANYGTAIAPALDAGSCSGDPNCRTIEMATLYVGAANEPNDTALLIKFQVDTSCTVTIIENATRGEVVSESIVDEPLYDVTINAPGCDIDIPPVGCPCAGDMDADGYVAFSDVEKLVTDMIAAGWFCMPGQGCWYVCGDYDNDGYMAFSDVDALVTYMIANGWFVICP